MLASRRGFHPEAFLDGVNPQLEIGRREHEVIEAGEQRAGCGWLRAQEGRERDDPEHGGSPCAHLRRPNDGSAGRISPSFGLARGGGGNPFFTYSSITFSSARAALSMFRSALFPS